MTFSINFYKNPHKFSVPCLSSSPLKTLISDNARRIPREMSASSLPRLFARTSSRGRSESVTSIGSAASAAAHKLCMIPGPVEFDQQVLRAMATPATSHVDPGFINTFGESIELMRKVFMAPVCLRQAVPSC
jgi:alanine-glyoxylate transaminase/serine-glyoxylate transaminase/serine-pyruvate transaminase